MSKKSEIQNAINISSLLMNVSEDIAKACHAAEIHPQLATVLMRMHNAQKDLDQRMIEIQAAQLAQAQLLDQIANNIGLVSAGMEALATKNGISMQSLFQPEERDDV